MHRILAVLMSLSSQAVSQDDPKVASWDELHGREIATTDNVPKCNAPGIVPARVVKPSAPIYPERLRQMWVQGFVDVQYLAAVDGTVRSIGILRSSPAVVFDDSARRAVESWKFRPATKDGVPVLCRGSIRVRYALTDVVVPGGSTLPSLIVSWNDRYSNRESFSRPPEPALQGAAGFVTVVYDLATDGTTRNHRVVASSLPDPFGRLALVAASTTKGPTPVDTRTARDTAAIAVFQIAEGSVSALRADVWYPESAKYEPQNAHVILPVQPDYPADAAARGIGGRVTVRYQVDEYGRSMNLRVAYSVPAGEFDEAALSAIRQTLHLPATREGIPIRSNGHERTFVFELTPVSSDSFIPLNHPLKLVPKWTRRARIGGYVRIRGTVGADGVLTNARIVGSEPTGVFDACAIQSLESSRFGTATYRGVRIAETAVLELSRGCSNDCAIVTKLDVPTEPDDNLCVAN